MSVNPGASAGSSAEEVERVDAFRVSGHPVHTRSLEIEVFEAEPAKVVARGTIIDLRKFGFVPTGGDLQSSGVIHNMSLDAVVDTASAVIERFEPGQSVVAFEASPRTGGESCRDSIHRLRDLAGERLDAAFSKRLSGAYGGALGCSHLLTLARLLAATVPQVLSLERAAHAARSAPAGGDAGPTRREQGERLFKRCIVLDGFELDGGRFMDVAVQLGDVFSVPHARVERPLDRFARQHEVRVLARIDMSDMTFASIGARERERVGAPLSPGGWESRDALLEPFVGGPAVYGLARQVGERMGDDPSRAALRDTLLNFAPGVIQCMAAFAHRMVEGDGQLGAGPSILQLGGLPDSCYIWREGGPGIRSRSGRIDRAK